jgi:diguanylate cyclase (GGDEF)-like protein
MGKYFAFAAMPLIARSRPITILAVSGILLIAAIAFGTVLVVFKFQDRALANSERELQNIALMLARHVDQQLEEVELVQKNILERVRSAGIASRQDYVRQMSGLDIHNALKEKISGLPHVSGVSLYDSNGERINSSRSWPIEVYQIDDRNYFKTLRSNPELVSVVSEPVRSRANGAWSIILARSLTAPDGEFLGVVVGSIELTFFKDFFSSISLGEYSSIALSRSDGVLLVRHPNIESAIGTSFPAAVAALGNRESGSIRLVGRMDGKDRLLTAHRSKRFPLFVTVGTDVAVVLGDWREQTKVLVGAASISVIVIAIVLFMIVRLLKQAHRQSKQRLALEKLRLDTAINNMTQGLLMFDSSERLVVTNRRYLEIYGLSPKVVKPGCTFRELICHRKETGSFLGDVDEYRTALLSDLAQEKATEVTIETPDGHSIRIVNLPMAGGGWVATHEDITERKHADERISHLAHYDALTDLPNRRLFRERLEQSLKRVQSGKRLALLYLDFDHFKNVNDTLGHPIGDELLKTVATRLRGCLRETDLVARLGGDEFAVIQTDVEQTSDITDLLAEIREAINAPYDLGGQQLITDASIGIAIAPDDGVDPDLLLKNADLAMYGAKTDGRGTYRFFQPEMDARMNARRALEFDLRQAIMCGEFVLHYQPLFNLQDNRVSGCEALVRWQHPKRGMISPAEFIPVAEETGLINQLGEWVIKTACVEAATWPDAIRIAVNVSPIQFKNPTLPLSVINSLAASGLSPRRLELEITEAVLIRDDEVALAMLHQLRELGVRIAMDDFGTGYSSLSYLQRFPFDKIKIDRAFTRDVAEPDGSFAIVRAVIGIAKSRDISTTAEGVETKEQLNVLRTLGCTEIQGYLFSRPVPAEELSQFFSGNSEFGVGAVSAA